MKNIIFTSILFLSFYLSYSQTSENAEEDNNEYRFLDVSFIQVGGTLLNMDFDHFNDRLSTLSLPGSFENTIFMPSAGLNITGSKFNERVYARFVFSYLEKEKKANDIKNVSSLLDAKIDLNVDLVKAPEHKLIGTIGYGWTKVDMSLTNLSNAPNAFDEVSQTFNDQNITSQNIQYLVLGAGYSYLFNEFFIGLEGGYRIALNSAEWETSSSSLADGPELSPKGFYLSAFFGFQIF